MSNTSFVANVNTLAQNISLIKDLSKSLTDTNVVILQKLLDEINLIPIIEDLEKGTFNGNRQIKINLIKNYFGYDKDMTEEELNSLYLDVSNAPEYSGVKLYLDDRSILELPFIQDGTAYNITTNVELYEFLMNNDDVVSRLTNTSFYMIPAQVVGTELVIADVANQLSNLLQIELISADNKSLEENPIYDWVEYTSALMILSQYFSAIQYLAYQIEDVLAVPDETQRIYDEFVIKSNEASNDLDFTIEQAYVRINELVSQAESTVNSILYKIADPETALVGQVLTVELVDGVKRVTYKSIADLTDFTVSPATKTTSGVVIVGDGLNVDSSGRISSNVAPATELVAGTVKITDDLENTDVNTVLNMLGVSSLKELITLAQNTAENAQNTADGKWTAVPATNSERGIVKVVNTIDSTDTLNPASASAVKTTYDLASASYNFASIANNSAIAAQSTANTAYNTANTANNTANAVASRLYLSAYGIIGDVGYIKWSNGLIIQWGGQTTENTSISFAIPFNNIGYSLNVGFVISGVARHIVSKTTTGFSTSSELKNVATTGGWFAIGY